MQDIKRNPSLISHQFLVFFTYTLSYVHQEVLVNL